MAGIDHYLQAIKTAIYGRDVRDSIHDAIKQSYTDANDVVKISETQPTEENVKLWVQPQATDYQVPTWEEFQALVSRVEALEQLLENS